MINICIQLVPWFITKAYTYCTYNDENMKPIKCIYIIVYSIILVINFVLYNYIITVKLMNRDFFNTIKLYSRLLLMILEV